MFVQILTAFILTIILLAVLAPLAHRAGLVDHPSARKQHTGRIPLIGGVGIFISLLLLIPLFSPLSYELKWYLAGAGMLVVFGMLDDRAGQSVLLRVSVEVVAAMFMVFGAQLWVGDLGNLLGFKDLHMPLWLSSPFTIIAVFGITNAWNMMDGMDGLAGTVTLVSLVFFYYLTHGIAPNNLIPALMLGSVTAYLMLNLGSNRLLPKVFLGDAGSKLIGFTLVWLLIDVTQGGAFTGMHLPAVLALFIVGLPLIDMVATTVRRIRKGQPAFAPDRTHIHHILLHAGFMPQEILLIIAMVCIGINTIGLLLYAMHAPAFVMFGVFWLITLIYIYNIEHAWKLSRWLHTKVDHLPKE